MQQLQPSSEPLTERLTPTSSRLYYGWVVVMACILVLAPTSLVLDGFSLLFVSVLNEFKWSREEVAMAMLIHMVVAGLSSPFAGGFIDRFGPRIVIPLGALLTALGYAWLSRCTSLWQFYIAFGVLCAVGSSMLYYTPLTSLVSNWFERHRGTAIGLVGVGQSIGQMLLPGLQYLINQIGWRGAYFILGAVIFILPTVLTLLFLYRRPEDRGLSIEAERPPWTQRTTRRRAGTASQEREVVILDRAWAETDWTVSKAVKTSRFWFMTLVLSLYAVGVFIISVQLVAFLVDKGYSSVMAASVMSVQGLMNMVGKFVGGVLCDRIGREKTFTLTVGCFLGSLVLLALSGWIVNPIVAYLYAIVFGIPAGMSLPSLMTSAADLFQGKHFGSILGVITLGGWTAGGLGAWLGGYLFDLTKGYTVNFIVAGVVMVTAAALMWKVRPGAIRTIRSVEVV